MTLSEHFILNIDRLFMTSVCRILLCVIIVLLHFFLHSLHTSPFLERLARVSKPFAHARTCAHMRAAAQFPLGMIRSTHTGCGSIATAEEIALRGVTVARCFYAHSTPTLEAVLLSERLFAQPVNRQSEQEKACDYALSRTLSQEVSLSSITLRFAI